MLPAAVLIASSELLPALEQRAEISGDRLLFSDAQPLEALEAILLHRPPLIVLERFFAATPRGAALINRIKADPGCANIEIRVLSHTGDYARVVVKPAAQSSPAPAAQAAAAPAAPAPEAAAASAPAVEPAPTSPPSSATAAVTTPTSPTGTAPVDWRGTRRYPRVRLREGLSLQIEGKEAVLVELSERGAQVVSPNVLRPGQKLRITLALEPDARLRAKVAWASFELAKSGGGPRYRAGIEFDDSDPRIAAYIQKNKAT